ncbi:Transposase, partial [Caligus rogercresseyi]
METLDFRSYFLIRIKLATTVNEIHGDLLSTFPNYCPGLSTLQRWHTEFDRGVFALEKKTRPGRSWETRTEENRITPDDHSTSCCRGVPTIYNCFQASDGGSRAPKPPQRASNKTQRVKCCQDLLKLFQDHKEDFLGSHLLVQDNGGKSGQSPRGPGSQPPCETDSEEDDDSDGVSITALPAGTTADRNTMIEYLKTTGKRFLSLKKDKIRLKDCLLRWDNARPHTATDTREFLTRRDVETVKQSPYSPDLNLCDRFLFQKLKHLLQEDEFGGHEEATLAVQRAIRRVSEDELYDQLRKLRGHCHDNC